MQQDMSSFHSLMSQVKTEKTDKWSITALAPPRTFVTVIEYEDLTKQRIITHQTGILDESIDVLLMELYNPSMAKNHRALVGSGGWVVGEGDCVYDINIDNFNRDNYSKIEATVGNPVFDKFYTILLEEV